MVEALWRTNIMQVQVHIGCSELCIPLVPQAWRELGSWRRRSDGMESLIISILKFRFVSFRICLKSFPVQNHINRVPEVGRPWFAFVYVISEGHLRAVFQPSFICAKPYSLRGYLVKLTSCVRHCLQGALLRWSDRAAM